jgi:hypothetical protein
LLQNRPHKSEKQSRQPKSNAKTFFLPRNAALADPTMRQKFAGLGGMMLAGSGGLRQVRRRRDRQMGQGDPRRQYCADGVSAIRNAPISTRS